MRRAEIWWAKMPLPAGRRPVVLVSRDPAYTVRSAITVSEISTVIRSIASEIPLSTRDGMPQKCVVNTDNLATIPKTWLESKITNLRASKLAALDLALKYSLGIA